MDMTAAIRAYQAAAKFYGEAQAAVAAASGKYHDAQETEQAGYRALLTAREELLRAAETLELPGHGSPLINKILQDVADGRAQATMSPEVREQYKSRPVKDNPQA